MPAALALSLAAPSAAAVESTAPVNVVLSIRDSGDCVYLDGVDAAVRRRSARIQFTEAGEHSVELNVNPERTQTGPGVWRASVELTRLGAREPERTLEATDCASLIDAIGFIVALTFDPPSAATPEPEPEPTPLAAPVAERGSKAAWVDEKASSPAIPSTPSAIELDVGAAFEVVSEAGPLVLPGVGLGMHLLSVPDPGFGVSLAAHLQVSAFPGRTVEEAAGDARFRLFAGRLSLCPLAFRQGVFTLRPCASGTWGALNARGAATREPEDHTRPWASVGGGLWAGVNAADNVRVDLDAGLGASLVRDAFQFEPDVFYRTAAVATRASIGLSLVLP